MRFVYKMVRINVIDAGHGDCLLVECGTTLILIDAGPESFLIRRNMIKSLKKVLRGRDIDLAIVTHDDDDHIGGFIEIIDDDDIRINRYLFNNLDYLGKIFRQNNGKKISYRQSEDLLVKLIEKGIEIDTALYEKHKGNNITISGVSITPITPTINSLQSLSNKYFKHKISRKKELNIDECRRLVESGIDKFKPDSSITNKASLSFIIEFDDFRGLFLADAHERDVVNYFNIENVSKKFSVVKLSHHGSEKNTSTNLLNLLDSNDYIICADKSHHNHPNNMTLARLFYNKPYSRIYFSSSNERMHNIKKYIDELNLHNHVEYSVEGVNRLSYE
ncbi:conserved hypothetical protein [Vibrio parahaemolyticus]